MTYSHDNAIVSTLEKTQSQMEKSIDCVTCYRLRTKFSCFYQALNTNFNLLDVCASSGMITLTLS